MTPALGVPAFVPSGSSVPVRSEQRVDLNCTLPALLELHLRIVDGHDRHGPLISLRASLALPELCARLIFRHRSPDLDAREELMRQVTVVPPEARVERIDDRPHSLPAGSLLSLRLIGCEGRSFADEMTIGECLEGVHHIRLPVNVDATASAWVAPTEVTERSGPTIHMMCALTVRRGVAVRVGSRPRRGEMWPGQARGFAMQLVRPGQAPHHHEETFRHGLPINSWALVAFCDERGQPIGAEQVIGRLVVI